MRVVAGAVGGQTKDIVESIQYSYVMQKKGQGRHEAGQQGSRAARQRTCR